MRFGEVAHCLWLPTVFCCLRSVLGQQEIQLCCALFCPHSRKRLCGQTVIKHSATWLATSSCWTCKFLSYKKEWLASQSNTPLWTSEHGDPFLGSRVRNKDAKIMDLFVQQWFLRVDTVAGRCGQISLLLRTSCGSVPHYSTNKDSIKMIGLLWGMLPSCNEYRKMCRDWEGSSLWPSLHLFMYGTADTTAPPDQVSEALMGGIVLAMFQTSLSVASGGHRVSRVHLVCLASSSCMDVVGEGESQGAQVDFALRTKSWLSFYSCFAHPRGLFFLFLPIARCIFLPVAISSVLRL